MSANWKIDRKVFLFEKEVIFESSKVLLAHLRRFPASHITGNDLYLKTTNNRVNFDFLSLMKMVYLIFPSFFLLLSKSNHSIRIFFDSINFHSSTRLCRSLESSTNKRTFKQSLCYYGYLNNYLDLCQNASSCSKNHQYQSSTICFLVTDAIEQCWFDSPLVFRVLNLKQAINGY